MSVEFFEAFQQLFMQGGVRLKRVLEQKLRAIKHSKRLTGDEEDVYRRKFSMTATIRKSAGQEKHNPREIAYF